jgi:lipopolysaccharide biosynthesis glycosyltransferase
MIRIFAGRDVREAKGWVAFCESVFSNTQQFVSLTPLCGDQRDGTNAFTYARFLVPSLCAYDGWALFLDGSDMILRDDIAKLWAMRDPDKAVMVVKHDYQSKAVRKYLGTSMESDNKTYPRKNWSSVVLWNCRHSAHHCVTPEFVRYMSGSYLHRFLWLKDSEIGELPSEWNHLVEEQEPNPAAKLVHFTLGIPAFPHYRDVEFSDEWRGYYDRATQIAV